MNSSQVFLANESVLNKIVEFAELNKEDVVIEIGSGDGRLTEKIAQKAAKVYAIEVDKELADISRQRLKRFTNVEIINQDALSYPFPDANKIISNLPYSIASPLTEKIVFYLNENNRDLAILMYQKEMADRLLAFPGLRDYSHLTVLVQYACDVEKLMDVSKVNFRPVPSVDSVLLKIVPKHIKIDRSFLSFCKVLFLHKKKNVYSALIDARELLGLSKDEIREKSKDLIFADEKVFYLEIEDLQRLYKECIKRGIWKEGKYLELSSSE